MLTPRTRGLTLVRPRPHLCFTGTHILEAKATREERLNGSRSRTLYFDAAGLELGELGPSPCNLGPSCRNEASPPGTALVELPSYYSWL